MQKPIKPEEAYHLINHGPCVLITTGDGTRRNVAPINWTMPLNNGPALILTVIEKGIFTEKLLSESGEFVVNVVGESLADKVLACGKCHGHSVDKFEKFNLRPIPSLKVRPPYLLESLAHIECRLIATHPYGSVSIFVGEVVYASVNEELWDGKSIIAHKAKTIHHLAGGTFAVSDRVIEVKRAPA